MNNCIFNIQDSIIFETPFQRLSPKNKFLSTTTDLKFMNKKFFFFLAVVYVCTAGCYKYEHQDPGNIDRPGIALTFDDYSIDNWFKYLPLLDSFGVKATFYISSYHLLTPQKKDKFGDIKRHGNA